MNISESTKKTATDFGLSILYLLFTFSMLSYFTMPQALVASILAGFFLGYIRQGTKGETVKKAAILSAFHLLMSVLMIFQWPHFIFFISSFLSVYWGITVELKFKTDNKKRAIAILSTMVPAILLALFAFPKFISSQLTTEGTGFIPEGKLLAADSTVFSTKAIENKIVVLDFWATWCAPCMKEMQNLKENYSELDTSNVELLFINAGSKRESFENFKSFTDTTSLSFNFYYDQDGSYTKQNDIKAYPTLLIIDFDGAIRYRHTGYYDGEDIVGYLNGKIREMKQKNN